VGGASLDLRESQGRRLRTCGGSGNALRLLALLAAVVLGCPPSRFVGLGKPCIVLGVRLPIFQGLSEVTVHWCLDAALGLHRPGIFDTEARKVLLCMVMRSHIVKLSTQLNPSVFEHFGLIISSTNGPPFDVDATCYTRPPESV